MSFLGVFERATYKLSLLKRRFYSTSILNHKVIVRQLRFRCLDDTADELEKNPRLLDKFLSFSINDWRKRCGFYGGTDMYQYLAMRRINTHISSPVLRSHSVHGINLRQFHLLRPDLVLSLQTLLNINPIVLMNSPPGSGKTSLISLLMHENRSFKYEKISMKQNMDILSLLKDRGIDLENQKTSKELTYSGQVHIFILDDAHRIYASERFWYLLKYCQSWFPSNIKMLLSVDHTIRCPREFFNLPSLKREHFLLSNDESLSYLNSPVGLQLHEKADILKKIVSFECGGNLAGLKISAHFLNSQKSGHSTENMLIDLFLSEKCLNMLNRCFRQAKTSLNSLSSVNHLISLALSEPQCLPASYKEYSMYEALQERGLIYERCGLIYFQSLLAKRYLLNNETELIRCKLNEAPLTIKELVVRALKIVSSEITAYSGETFELTYFTFIPIFLLALFKVTPKEYSVNHAQSLLTALSTESSMQVFLIKSSVNWGIGITHHGDPESSLKKNTMRKVSSFLGLEDHAVIELRESTRFLTKSIPRHHGQVTVLYTKSLNGAFEVIFGTETESVSITVS
jgi:hypothetical protein